LLLSGNSLDGPVCVSVNSRLPLILHDDRRWLFMVCTGLNEHSVGTPQSEPVRIFNPNEIS